MLFWYFSRSIYILHSSFINIYVQASTSATAILNFPIKFHLNLIFTYMKLSCLMQFVSWFHCLLLISFFFLFSSIARFHINLSRNSFFTSKTLVFYCSWLISFFMLFSFPFLLFWMNPLHAPHQVPHNLWKHCIYWY